MKPEEDIKWDEVEKEVARIRYKYPFSEILGQIERNPITKESIDELIQEGWKVKWGEDSSCSTKKKTIYLEEGIRGYERDGDLFHELVHAFYPEDLSDVHSAYKKENYKIVEWLARQLRADPEILKHTINSFRLKPYIYDKSSFDAFYNGSYKPSDLDFLNKQMVFPFFEKEMKKIKDELIKMRDIIKETKMN